MSVPRLSRYLWPLRYRKLRWNHCPGRWSVKGQKLMSRTEALGSRDKTIGMEEQTTKFERSQLSFSARQYS